ncbi:MAG: iron-containing alcohol dehydrogenase [bacterium]|nr:iron-containing alcohol dehydrogenase [bacterium]
MDTAWAVDLGGVHVVFGDGSLERLGECAFQLGGRRALLVTDGGIVRAGHAERSADFLRRAAIAVRIFAGAAENPTTRDVERGVAAAREHGADLVVGLGGGSAMDCAKGINFLLTNGGKMEDYWGDDKAPRAMLPSIGVPTTAGTGSEAQRFTLITQADTHRKMACGDRKARFRTVILDPRLITSMPRPIAATSGIDAISHALESYVTRRRNPISQLFAREAWVLLERSFETFLDQPQEDRARARMLLGAHLAGAAVEASMLGAAHSCANPLTAHYDVTHGIAVGLMLPHVIDFNGAAVADLYAELARAADLPDADAVRRLSERVAELRRGAGLAGRLRDCGVEESRLETLAEDAAGQWTAQFNPRPVTGDDLRRLYEEAF